MAVKSTKVNELHERALAICKEKSHMATYYSLLEDGPMDKPEQYYALFPELKTSYGSMVTEGKRELV